MNIKNGILITLALLLLVALAGNVQATPAYFTADPVVGCTYCHESNLNLKLGGINFNATHRFDGADLPEPVASCTECHTKITSPSNYSLTSMGQNYSESHRYNSTTLASTTLAVPGCASCHDDANAGNFTIKTGTPTFLTSETCENCHKAKYDVWSNTLHRVMLTPRVDAEAMNLPLPSATVWNDIGFVRITKFGLAYVNTTGYFLAGNYSYDTENMNFTTDSRNGSAYCGANCHTTGWNDSAVNTEFPGIPGTFAEAGIGCERCHGAAGNGHQVTINYSATLCTDCHSGSHHGTGWEDGAHAPPATRTGSSCTQCHSPFDKYQTNGVTPVDDPSNANIACGVCHDIHNMTDDQYAETFTDGIFNATEWSEVANAKLSFFNGTASLAAGTDIFDDLAAESASTGVGEATILCSKCHISRHGLGHTEEPFTDLSHGNVSAPATCIDCHMEGASATVGKDMMDNHDNEIVDGSSCGGGGSGCHGNTTTGSSMQKRYEEWGAGAHNVKEVGVGGAYNHYYGENETVGGVNKSRNPSCNKCHDPLNYDASDDAATENEPLSENFKGVTCTVCHPLHDMRNFMDATNDTFGEEKAYGLFTKVAVASSHGTSYKGTYTMVEDTTELCGSCHASVRIGRDGPGWVEGASDPTTTHGYPAADLFVGSWKQTSPLTEFECTSCHYATMTKDENDDSLPYDERISGHSFKINTTLLQNNTECSGCHMEGSTLGNISTTIENVQARTNVNYEVANLSVTAALAEVKANEDDGNETGMSRELIAQAYWNFKLVGSDESMGVHNPSMVDELLDDAIRLSQEAIDSIGVASVPVSTVSLSVGWNLVALNGTPTVTSADSVMESVADNITIVWGYDTTSGWEYYIPETGSPTDTLVSMVPGKGYWIYAEEACEWTV